MFDYKGKTALITGASSGIGESFAHALAGRGMNLILVARSKDKLQELATELATTHQIRAEVVACDLSCENATKQIQQTIQERGLSVDFLVNNAGFGIHGNFETLSTVRQHEEVMLNVTALVDLAQAFLPAMVAKGNGAVINVASVAGFQPVPYMAIYGATKAFVLSFSEALWGEYRNKGVKVLALCPGATATLFFEVAGEGAALGNKQTPQQVVEVGLKALEKGKSYVISGTQNYLLAQSSRFAPRSIVTLLGAQMFKPRAPKGSVKTTKSA